MVKGPYLSVRSLIGIVTFGLVLQRSGLRRLDWQIKRVDVWQVSQYKITLNFE